MIAKWRLHNPTFEADGGRIVLLGHSLGSLICFDLLAQGQLLEPLRGVRHTQMERLAHVHSCELVR